MCFKNIPKAQTQTLKHSNTSGRFACAHSRQCVGPGLHVSGIGAVSVPLAQSVYDQLRQICQQKDLPQQGPAGQSDHKLWQLNLALLAANNPGKLLKHCWAEGFADWEGTVCSLAQHLSHELGLLSTASVEAVLQQVTLYDNPNSFNFSLEADTPPNAFANAETCGGAAMGKPWPHLGGREYCACADICKLVVTALELFQTLTTKARQAGTSAEGAGVLLLTSICCFAEMHVTF